MQPSELTEITDRVQRFLRSGSEDARRLFHGRGGVLLEWKHVAIDWYAPALLVTFYEDQPANPELLDALQGLVNTLLVQRRYLEGSPVNILTGTAPQQAHESGLRYHLSLEKNQNHGFFPDMKPGRDWIRECSSGKRVLNLFAYTCAISVAAIAGGAEEVVNLDQSSASLSTGRANHRLNFDVDLCRRVKYLPLDLFKSWGRLKRLALFDVVVLDPPSHQPGSFVAKKDYPRMLRRLPEILSPRAEILACLNAPELDENFLPDLMAEHVPKAKLIKQLSSPDGYVEMQPQHGLKRMLYHCG